jgi:hypothetical protein
VNGERWWWAERAQQLKLSQLDTARKQAEAWRTGLAGVTALLGAVLVVKGRDDFTALAAPYPIVVLTLFGLALAALVLATLAALRAASGAPGDEILVNGEELRAWTEAEVVDAYRAIRAARLLTVAGVCLVAAAATTTWLAPTGRPETPLVRVEAPGGVLCGRLLQHGDGILRVGEEDEYRIVPLTSTVAVRVVESC